MGATDRGVVVVRLKREECKRTKHDSAFSDWKILVGPTDWEEYLAGKEGAEKYRTQNLPNCASCSGVYELGVAVSRRGTSRLERDCIVPVYVGKSDNVRTRLQRYGREGAHLENGQETVSAASKRAGLFTEAFSRGLFIFYRWAPMNNNKDAEETEAQLLDKFDYAWNKGSNGIRRHNDVLCKLDDISRATRLPAFIRKLQFSLERQKGIRIKACEPLLLENGSDFHDRFERTSFLPRIFKLGRSQPRLVLVSYGVNGDPHTLCGVALGHGSVCIRPPIMGNKRCAEHKGMKVNCANSKLKAEGMSFVINESAGLCASRDEENAPICGFILDSGAPCARKPFKGNKRCLEHKGRRIQAFVPQVVKDKTGLEYRTYTSNDRQQMLSNRAYLQHHQDFSSSLIPKNHDIICGVHLNDGALCTRQPAVGRKRCEEHKGMRVKEPIPKHLGAEIPSVLAGPTAETSGGKKHWNMDSPLVNHSTTCGATLLNGSCCRRKPSGGNKRCWQHKGMGPTAETSGGKKHWNMDSPLVNHSATCGATLRNGSCCSRKPSGGNKRCWQHKGMKS